MVDIRLVPGYDGFVAKGHSKEREIVMGKGKNKVKNVAPGADNTAPTTDTTPAPPQEKRKRGRPKGVKVGPRPVVWTCVENIDGDLVSDMIQAEGVGTAKAIYEEKHGVSPSICMGPFYEVKAGANKSAAPRKRETISMNVNDIRFGAGRREAVFNGWLGTAFDIEGRDDAVLFFFSKEVAPGEKKRATPGAKPVLKSALQPVPQA